MKRNRWAGLVLCPGNSYRIYRMVGPDTRLRAPPRWRQFRPHSGLGTKLVLFCIVNLPAALEFSLKSEFVSLQCSMLKSSSRPETARYPWKDSPRCSSKSCSDLRKTRSDRNRSTSALKAPVIRPAVVAAPASADRKELEPLAVSLKQAAFLLGVKEPTIRKHMRQGTIPRVRVGKRVLVPMKALKDLVLKGTWSVENGENK